MEQLDSVDQIDFPWQLFVQEYMIDFIRIFLPLKLFVVEKFPEHMLVLIHPFLEIKFILYQFLIRVFV